MAVGERERSRDKVDEAALIGSANSGVAAGHPLHAVPVRGTQSFVHTLSACWKRPSLTALEVAWRWAFGAPAVVLMGYEATRILHGTPLDTAALQQMSIADPMSAAATLTQAAGVILPPVLHVVMWLGPLLLVGWVIASSIGRTLVLRRVDAILHARPGTLMVLQALRMVALVGSFVLWFACLRAIAEFTVNAPIAGGQEPNLVLYCALNIVTTLGMFTLWAIASWALAVAPLLAMLRNAGAGASLSAALRVGPLRSKVVEINLVMGIVKIALIVLAMVFSACPLPFESVATPDFMLHWYAVVTILYFIASDFFHVARLVSYLELWKAFDAGAPGD
jgi:hypothetical protein